MVLQITSPGSTASAQDDFPNLGIEGRVPVDVLVGALRGTCYSSST